MPPSIKGYAVLPIVQQIRAFVDGGSMKLDEVEQRLSDDALALLDTEPGPTLWYPISLHDEYLTLLQDFEGGRNPNFLHEHGFDSAGEILSAPSISLILSGARALRLNTGPALVRMAQLMLNFGKWSFEGPGMHDFEIDAREVGPLPNSVRWHTEGFISQVATRIVGESVGCQSTRPTRDHIKFRGCVSEG